MCSHFYTCHFFLFANKLPTLTYDFKMSSVSATTNQWHLYFRYFSNILVEIKVTHCESFQLLETSSPPSCRSSYKLELVFFSFLKGRIRFVSMLGCSSVEKSGEKLAAVSFLVSVWRYFFVYFEPKMCFFSHKFPPIPNCVVIVRCFFNTQVVLSTYICIKIII